MIMDRPVYNTYAAWMHSKALGLRISLSRPQNADKASSSLEHRFGPYVQLSWPWTFSTIMLTAAGCYTATNQCIYIIS